MTDEKIREAGAPVVIRGIGVGRGVAIGKLRFDPIHAEGERREAAGELAFFEGVLKATKGEILALREQAVRSVGEEHGEVYDLHLGMLEGELSKDIKKRIRGGIGLSAAIEERLALLDAGDGMDRPRRARNVHEREVLSLLREVAEEGDVEPIKAADGGRGVRSGEKYVLVSSGDGSFVKGPEGDEVIGIVCVGGTESAGLGAYARAKGIPALVVSHEDAPDIRYEGSGAIIDPERNRLTVNPDLAALDRFTESAKRSEEREERLSRLIGRASVTRSGKHISVFATVSEGEVASAASADAEGIGLFKTESLFSEKDPRETEERNFAEYKKAIGIFKGKPMTVRAFAGGRGGELGQRGVRYCLAVRDTFKAQIRAMLRAASFGELWMGVPRAVSPEEIRRVRAVVSEAASELRGEGIAFGELRLGAIIDTPAAAINGELLAPECDFFLIDSDALSELTLAADRADASVREIIRKNPGPILSLVGYAARIMRSAGKTVGVAGDLAEDLSLTARLISLGIDHLSVSPPAVLEVRERIVESE